MRIAIIISTVAAFLMAHGSAQAILFDLEDAATAAGISSMSTTEMGLTMTITRVGSQTTFDIGDLSTLFSNGGGVAASFGDRTLGFPSGESVYIADFSAPLSSFAAAFGDFGADDDSPVSLMAYGGAGGTGALLDSATDAWIADQHFADTLDGPGSMLVSSGTPIQSVVFGSGGRFNNSLFWDNFDATLAPVGVPESSTTFVLLGLGFLTLVGYKRKAEE